MLCAWDDKRLDMYNIFGNRMCQACKLKNKNNTISKESTVAQANMWIGGFRSFNRFIRWVFDQIKINATTKSQSIDLKYSIQNGCSNGPWGFHNNRTAATTENRTIFLYMAQRTERFTHMNPGSTLQKYGIYKWPTTHVYLVHWWHHRLDFPCSCRRGGVEELPPCALVRVQLRHQVQKGSSIDQD